MTTQQKENINQLVSRTDISGNAKSEMIEGMMIEYANEKVKELELMIEECIDMPKGIEPHSVSDYKSKK